MRIRQPKLWAALFALLIAGACIPRARKLGSPDFKVFYVAARHVFTDPDNLYKISPDRYLYPPSTAILLTPFAFTEHYAFHQWVWHGLLALLVFLLGGESGAALAALVILSRYLAITFGYGQINLVVIGMLALAGLWLRRAPGRAGGIWALAATAKVYPAVFAPAFLPKENRRGILVGAAIGALILTLPFLVFGASLGAQLYGEFFRALESKGLPLHSHNQSIAALLLRLFTNQDFYLHAVGETRWALLDLPPGLVRLGAWILGIGLAAASWEKAFRRGTPEAYLSAAAFCILFLSHIVWKDYLLFLYFPLRDFFGRASRRRSWILGASFVAMVTLSSPDVVGAPLSTRLDAACIHLWAAVLVWVVWWRK